MRFAQLHRRPKSLRNFVAIQRSASRRRKYSTGNSVNGSAEGDAIVKVFIILVWVFIVVSCS